MSNPFQTQQPQSPQFNPAGQQNPGQWSPGNAYQGDPQNQQTPAAPGQFGQAPAAPQNPGQFNGGQPAQQFGAPPAAPGQTPQFGNGQPAAQQFNPGAQPGQFGGQPAPQFNGGQAPTQQFNGGQAPTPNQGFNPGAQQTPGQFGAPAAPPQFGGQTAQQFNQVTTAPNQFGGQAPAAQQFGNQFAGPASQPYVGDPFADPTGPGSGEKITSFLGYLLLVKPLEYIPTMDTSNGPSDAVRADVVLIDGPQPGYTARAIYVFQKGLKRDLRAALDGQRPFMLGRLAMGEAKPGKNAPYIFLSANDTEKGWAQTWLNQNPGVL